MEYNTKDGFYVSSLLFSITIDIASNTDTKK